MALRDEWLGSYTLSSSEKFEELMKVYNVGIVMRKMANSAYPVLTISRLEDGRYKFTSVTTFKASEFVCKLDEEFDENTADGACVKTSLKMVNDFEIVQIQQAADKPERPESIITRVLEGDVITMTIKAGGVTCIRKYRRNNK